MFEIFRDKAGQFRYRVKGSNGEIVATSEAYTRRRDAERGFDDLRRLIAGMSKPDKFRSN